jgi:ribosome maturation factor RimP
LTDSLSQPLAAEGFDLEDVSVTKAGARSVVRVVVDRDGGIDLDAVAEASRLVSAVLDEGDGPLPGAYVLEVTSPGVDRPLTRPRHWQRAVGRLVAVRTQDGRRVVARLTGADDTAAEIVPRVVGARAGAKAGAAAVGAGSGQRLAYADVAHAVVQIEFSRADDHVDGDQIEDDQIEDDIDDDNDDDVEGTEQ